MVVKWCLDLVHSDLVALVDFVIPQLATELVTSTNMYASLWFRTKARW